MCNLFFSSASLLELQIQHCPWHNVVKRQAVRILKEKVKDLFTRRMKQLLLLPLRRWIRAEVSVSLAVFQALP